MFDTAKIGASPPLLEWLSVILLGWPPQRGRGHRIADKRLETPERVLHGAIRQGRNRWLSRHRRSPGVLRHPGHTTGWPYTADTTPCQR